ncbi:hypothetical protein B0H13DRAFT_2378368 [Mycena leptocephala]|nr:hypothetical protein B0H13DRAFT_2378368 [Mycena leptocephala]
MCTTKSLCILQDRVARVQHWQRENFETLEIEAGGEAAEKQMQILWRSLDYDQSSEGLYLNYLLVAQKYSPDGSLARLTADGASKLRHHSLQAPKYGAGQYSKPNSMERDNMRSGHTDNLYGHPAISLSLFCSTSPSPPPLAAQSLPANHSSSLGVPISHNRRADVYASPPDTSGSRKALFLPSLSPNPPLELAVLRSGSDHPVGTKNIRTNTYSPSRMFPCSLSSCSLPPNSQCENTSVQEATCEHMTCSSPNAPAVVLAPTSLRSIRLHCTELCSGMNAGSIPLQFVATSTTLIRFALQHVPLPAPCSRPNMRREQPAIRESLCLGTRHVPWRDSIPHISSLSVSSDVAYSDPQVPLHYLVSLPLHGPAHHHNFSLHLAVCFCFLSYRWSFLRR